MLYSTAERVGGYCMMSAHCDERVDLLQRGRELLSISSLHHPPTVNAQENVGKMYRVYE
jgi:hypothetical protein